MKRLAALLALLAAPAAAEVRTGSFNAPSLGREASYWVELPASYADGQRRYPVLYVLHGLFEGPAFWERRGLAALLRQLQAEKAFPEAIVVAVDGSDSFFVNGPRGRYQDLVTRDLVSHVEATYRAVPGRGARALLGVSMGGYAALRIALAEPEVFAAVATHSAMLLRKPPTREDGARGGQLAAFARTFGDPIDPALWKAADPLALAAGADPALTPALSFDCGAQDRYGLAEGHQELDRRLTERGVRHEFALPPGDHGYEYVRSVLERSLRFIDKALSPPAAKPPSPSPRSTASPRPRARAAPPGGAGDRSPAASGRS
jgi:putative tributyrin esterase